MLPLTVKVVEGTEMGPVFYKINHERDGRSWMVQQRFSTLHAMRDTLNAEKAELPDVAFPPKQWPLVHLWQAPCTPALPPDEMEARRSGLQAYLTALSELKESWGSSTVKEVLCCPADDVSPPAASSATVQAAPRAVASPPVVKAVSWIDQQQPTTAATSETEEATTALLSLATSPPIRSGIDSSATPTDATSKMSAPTVEGIKDASEKHQAGKKKRRSALVRSFDAFVSSTAASKTSASKTAAAAATAAVKKSGAAKEVADSSAQALAEPAEVGSRGRSLSVSGDEAFSPAPMGSSRGGDAETVPAVVAPTVTGASAGTAATAAPVTSPVTQPLRVTVAADDVVAPSAMTPRAADEPVGGRREVPGEMLLSAVMADVDSVAGQQVGSVVPAPISDQSLLTPSAQAAYDAVAEGEGSADIAREREEASAVSALGLSSASEEAGNDGVAALVENAGAGAGIESLPTPATPAAAQRRRSSLLGRAKRSLSSKKGLDKDKDKDKDKEVPLSSLGVDSPVLPVPNAPMTPGSAATPRTPGRLASIRDRARSLKGRFSTGGAGGSGPLSLASAKSKGKGFFSMSAASPEADVLPPPVAVPEIDTTGKPDYVMAVAFSPVSLSSPPSPPNVGMVKVNSGTFMALGGKGEGFAAPPSPGGD